MKKYHYVSLTFELWKGEEGSLGPIFKYKRDPESPFQILRGTPVLPRSWFHFYTVPFNLYTLT